MYLTTMLLYIDVLIDSRVSEWREKTRSEIMAITKSSQFEQQDTLSHKFPTKYLGCTNPSGMRQMEHRIYPITYIACHNRSALEA